MTTAQPTITVNLQGKIPPIRSRQGRINFLEAISRPGAFLVLVRYAINGIPQETGVRLDLGKRAILDDFSDAKRWASANASLRNHRAHQIWDAVVEGLREKKLETAADRLYSIGLHHGWWGDNAKPSWRNLDLIGREEFLDVTAAVITAYNYDEPHQPVARTPSPKAKTSVVR